MCFHTYNSIASSLLSINRDKKATISEEENTTCMNLGPHFQAPCHSWCHVTIQCHVTRLALCLCFNLIESRLLGSLRTQQLNEWVCIFEMRLTANELKERWRGSEECLRLEDFSPAYRSSKHPGKRIWLQRCRQAVKNQLLPPPHLLRASCPPALWGLHPAPWTVHALSGSCNQHQKIKASQSGLWR